MENLTEDDFQRVADWLGVEVAAIKTVQTVETSDHGGSVVPGGPIILFEGHAFWHELKKWGSDPEKYVIGNENILYPSWRREHHYGGIREYERLEKARRIHKGAAGASTSWGMFQVMGFNYVMCRYDCVNEVVRDMCTGEDKQLEAFAKFIKSAGLRSNLERKDWTGSSKKYNDPGYVRNQCDKKLEEAYWRFTKQKRDIPGFRV